MTVLLEIATLFSDVVKFAATMIDGKMFKNGNHSNHGNHRNRKNRNHKRIKKRKSTD